MWEGMWKMRLKDIRIGYKILILVIVGLAGMAVLGFTGYRAMSKAGEDMDNMYNRKLKATRELGNEINYMRMTQVRIVKHILDPNDAAIKASIGQAMDSYEKTWPEYRAMGMKADQAAVEIPNTEKKWAEYKQGILETQRLVDAGETQEAWIYYKGVEAGVTQDLLKSLTTLQKIADDDADTLNNEIMDTNAQQLMFMSIVTVVAFLLLIGLAIYIIREITGSLNRMVEACTTMKDGDFRVLEEPLDRGDELGAMDNAMHLMRKTLNKLMREVSSSAEQLAASAEEMTASSNQAAQASTQVAQAAAEVVEAVENQQKAVMNSNESVQRTQDSAAGIKQEAVKVADNSAAAADRTAKGSQAIDDSVRQIKNVEQTVNESAIVVDRLGERSKEIGEIVDTMSAIADQTNLLALNAAIEAARAGEHGRGFTVVAEEVGKLAQESQESAQKIAKLIQGIQSDTDSAVVSMRSGREAVVEGARSVEGLRTVFDDINQLIAGVSDQIEMVTGAINGMAADTTAIAGEVSEINTHSGKVASEMQAVSAATEEQSASAEEIAAASDSLAKLAQNQQAALAYFQF